MNGCRDKINHKRMIGLTAATLTPMSDDRQLNLQQVPRIVDFLYEQGINGIFVCGSTGEGLSLTTRER